jgi:metal-responsive CopG/Arc/MetJ family transcriptional regulator
MAKKIDPNRPHPILIHQPFSSARKLDDIAINKGFKNRKEFIENLCNQQVKQFDAKQLKLI